MSRQKIFRWRQAGHNTSALLPTTEPGAHDRHARATGMCVL